MSAVDYGLAAGVLLVTYSVNLLYITVFYHRAFTHGGIDLRAGVRRFAWMTSKWVTGLDLKAWVCMHRIHHRNADTPLDPHSPSHVGVFGVALAQLRAYREIRDGLARGEPQLCAVVEDLGGDLHWLTRSGAWFTGTAVHLGLAGLTGMACGSWLPGAAYLVGMSSHPLQGWLVNSLGHAVGSRNFDTPDQSRNNRVAAWLVWGEGLQNNHHAYPGSARFSYRWWEPDFGFHVCRAMERLGLLRVRRDKLIPRPSQAGLARAGDTEIDAIPAITRGDRLKTARRR